MRQFLRFALIFVLIIIGFGGGVCGVFGLAMSVTAGKGTGLVLVLSAVGLLRYDNVFRLLIVQFMDAHSLDIRALKKSCIHFARPDGRLIPFESYNLFYRDHRADVLETIRNGLARSFRERAAIIPIATEPTARARSR